MSVDYYSCSHCNKSVYEEYIGSCNKCGKELCTDCLINDDVKSKYAYRYGYVFDSSNPELMERYIKEGFELYNDSGDPFYEDGDIIDDSWINSKYCPFCSGTSVDRDRVLDYIVKKYKIDINNEWNELLNKTK